MYIYVCVCMYVHIYIQKALSKEWEIFGFNAWKQIPLAES